MTMDITSLPTKAGSATIEYDPMISTPIRTGDVIHIPVKGTRKSKCVSCDRSITSDWKFCPNCGIENPFPELEARGTMRPVFDDWSQFVFYQTNPGSLWFGGTDERPFLVRLDANLSRDFDKGVDTFFDAMVPDLIKQLEARFGEKPRRRQGDIFMYELPYGFSEIRGLLSMTKREPIPEQRKETPVYGTRHTFSGRFFRCSLLGTQSTIIGQGKLIAPDHEPVALRSTHALAQARGLFSPKIAD